MVKRSLVLLAAVLWCGVGLSQCSPRADSALCERAGDRLVEVSVEAKLAATDGLNPETAREAAVIDAKDARARFMKACVSSSRAVVVCIAEAKDLAAVQGCQR